MALDFPTSPALNEIYTYGGRSWKWNGTAWDVYSTVSGDVVTKLNGLTGGVTLAAGSNITLTPVGNTITIASSGGGGTGSGATGATGATGPQGNTGPVGDYVSTFNGLTGAVTGVTLGGAAFTGLVSSTVGFSGPGTNLIGNASGLTAGSASKVQISEAATSTVHYLALATGTGNTGIYIDTSAPRWTYTPSTGLLTTPTGILTAPTINSSGTVYTNNINTYVYGNPITISSDGGININETSGTGLDVNTIGTIRMGDISGFDNGYIFAINESAGEVDFSGMSIINAGGVVTTFNGLYGAVTGVSKLNGLSGGVTLAAGTNITLTPVGNTITIASSGGGGGSSVYGVTASLDFSENINGIRLTIGGTGSNGTDLSVINKAISIVPTISTSGATYSCVFVSATPSYSTATSQWAAKLILKPPFGTGVTSASTIIAAPITQISLYVTGLTGNTYTDNWTNISGSDLYHQDATYVTKTLTGITWVSDSMFLNCKVLGLTSADHTPEDAILEGVNFEINNILGGTGFDIIGHAPEGTYGKYTIKCLGQ